MRSLHHFILPALLLLAADKGGSTGGSKAADKPQDPPATPVPDKDAPPAPPEAAPPEAAPAAAAATANPADGLPPASAAPQAPPAAPTPAVKSLSHKLKSGYSASDVIDLGDGKTALDFKVEVAEIETTPGTHVRVGYELARDPQFAGVYAATSREVIGSIDGKTPKMTLVGSVNPKLARYLRVFSRVGMELGDELAGEAKLTIK